MKIIPLSNVPNLRFTDFKSDWSNAFLEEVVTSLDAGVSVNSENIPIKGRELGVLKTSCVTKGYFDPSENKRVLDQAEIKRLKEPVSKYSILISRMNTPALVGLNGFVTKDISNLFLPDRLWAAKVSPNHSPHWVAQLLASEKIRNQLSSRASGTSGSMKNITKGDVLTLPVYLPPLPEQQKIATFLTAVDERVQQLIHKKALLEDYKKGVMQELFNQTIRFKNENGNDFPDWEEKPLGEAGEIVGGGTPESSNESYWGGDIVWFTPTEIRSKYVSQSNRTITEAGLKNSSASILPVGTILLTSRATIAEVSIATRTCTTNQGFQSIIARTGSNNEFLYYWVIQSKKEFLRKAQGSTFLEIGGKEVRKIIINLPSLPEQTKIADFLSSIDLKIKSVSTQITQTQTFKRGLLQQMFV